MKDLEEKMANGELANKYNKLEVQRFQEEIDELNRLYGGIKDMNSRPGALFVTDIIADSNAVREANKIGIPIVAIVDTNADPSQVTYPIPANDDAIKSLQLICDYVAAAVNEGRGKAAKAAPAPDKDEQEAK
jgi:small subunit ribosomal protein S2